MVSLVVGLSLFQLGRDNSHYPDKWSCDKTTDKRTDVWSRNFITWKINFGLWAVAWAGLWEKGVWADSEQLFWVVFSIFRGQKIKKRNLFLTPKK